MKDTENLLFSAVTTDGQVSVTETLLSFGVFEVADVPALFQGNAVGRPIPVMVEGTYYVRAGEKFKPVTFTADDIKRIAAKQPRDVPFNYDHQRAPGAAGVKGWLRFGRSGETDLHYVGEVTTREGQTLSALFATPELSAEAQGLVQGGVYRDVSVEYRGVDDVLTGCALTSYPVMRNLQFSEIQDQVEAQPDPVEQVEADEPPQEEDVDVSQMDPAARKALLDTLLGDHGLSVDTLVAFGEKAQADQAAAAVSARDAALTRAEGTVRTALGESFFGMTDEIATQAQETLAWAELQGQTLNFGEDGTPDVTGLVTGLLGVIGKQGAQIVALGGPAAAVSAEGETQFGDVTPDATVDEVKTVSGLLSLAQTYLK